VFESPTPGTDEWWLMRLASELGAKFPRLAKLRRYKNGDAPVEAAAIEAMNESYHQFNRRSRLHVVDLIVNSKVNRQKVLGFRTAAAGDALGDTLGWDNWMRSRMDLQSRKLFTDGAHYGQTYVIVTGSTGDDPTAEGFTKPGIIVADPWSTHANPKPTQPWLNDHAIQIARDEINEQDVLTLFGPGWYRVAVHKSKLTTINTEGVFPWQPGTDWEWAGPRVDLAFTKECVVVTYGTVDGFGVYEKHLDTVDRVIDGIRMRMTISAMQAFRQRALIGDLPEFYPADHPMAGERIDYDGIFKAGPAAMWRMPADSKIWESEPTDIRPLLESEKNDVKNLAAFTSTAIYLLSPDAAGGSAEGASLAKEAMNGSVDELNEQAGATFSIMQGLMFQALRDSVRADSAKIKTIFGSVDRIDIAARSAAAAQAKAAGRSQAFIDEYIYGLSPEQMEQEKQNRADELLQQQVAAEAEADAQLERDAKAAEIAAAAAADKAAKDARNNDPAPDAPSKRGITSDPAKR
jgi:hypothetical protein